MGSKEMTKDVKEVIDKGDLLDSGKEGEDGVENTLEETSVVGSAGWENEAKRSEDVVEEKQDAQDVDWYVLIWVLALMKVESRGK